MIDSSEPSLTIWFGATVSVGATLLTVTGTSCVVDAAVVVGDGDGDGVDAVVGVDVAAVERAGRRHARASRARRSSAAPESTVVPSPQLIA